MTRRLIFATLGPAGSNHEYVTERDLALHGPEGSEIRLVDDVATGLAMISSGEVDFIVQVAVHPDATDTVARAHFEHDIRVIDAFVSPSRPLAVLTRAEVGRPTSLGLQPAPAAYLNTRRLETQVPEVSIMTVAEGLLKVRFDSGITTLSVADDHPGRFRVKEELGTVDDPWIVYGRERISSGNVVAWPEGPAARLNRAALAD